MLCQSPENQRSLRLRFVGPMKRLMSNSARGIASEITISKKIACGSIWQSSQERVYALAKTELRAPPPLHPAVAVQPASLSQSIKTLTFALDSSRDRQAIRR